LAPRVVRAIALTLAAWLGAAGTAAAQKTDIVELLNGDRITGEIQKLDRGKLTVKTDGLSTISIEWDDVARVTSTARFDVELASGTRMEGSVARADSRTLDLVTASGSERLRLDTIVRMSRLGRTFWRKLDGSISAGFSFTQANEQTQWTFDSNVTFRGHKWLVSLNADSLLTTSEDNDSQTRNDVGLEFQRFIRPRWSYVGWTFFQQNEELSLNLRSVLGGGIVYIPKQSNKTRVQLGTGVAFTQEEYSGEGDQSVAEAVNGIKWEWFTFDGRSTNLAIDLLTFSKLDSDSRFRFEFNTSFKSDIVGDLYWSITAFESYNSEPPTDQKKSDFGMTASLGWTF
jgi:putative salt-induced outer membrane protein YdiY